MKWTNHKFTALLLLITIVSGYLILQLKFNHNDKLLTYEEWSNNEQKGDVETFRQIENYWQLVRLDPILAFPGIKLETIDDDLAMLEKSVDVFREFYTEPEFETISNYLFPTRLIKDVSILEDKRRHFVNQPSKTTAIDYHDQLIATLERFEQETLSLSTYFKTIDDFKIAFISGYTNAHFIANKLDDISSQVQTLKAVEMERFACIENPQKCKVISDPFASASLGVGIIDTSSVKIPEQAVVYAKILEKYYLANSATEKGQPLVVKGNSLCYPYQTPVVMRVWWPSLHSNSEQHSIRTTVVNDIMLQPNADFGDHTYHKAILDLGVIYDIQDTAPYFCLDYAEDSSEVLTALDIYGELQTQQILNDKVSDLNLRQAYKLENEIRSTVEYLHVSTVANYFFYIDKALQDTGERAVAEQLGIDTYRKLMELRLLWKSQSSFFNENVLLYSDLTSHLKNGILPRFKIPLLDLIITRSYMSFFYFTYNKTVFESEMSFLSEAQTIGLDKFKMKSYGNQIQFQLPLQSFEEYLKKFITIDRSI
jgi:hypothetical protein